MHFDGVNDVWSSHILWIVINKWIAFHSTPIMFCSRINTPYIFSPNSRKLKKVRCKRQVFQNSLQDPKALQSSFRSASISLLVLYNTFHIHDFFFNLVLASRSINSSQELLFLKKPKTPASLLLEASSENRIFMKLMTKKIHAMREKLVDKERKVTSLLGHP